MDICYPALTTSALFFTFLILDLVRRNYRAMTGHFLFGAIAVLLMLYLCQSGADILAWGLLAVPVIFLLLGVIIGGLPSTEPVPSSGPVVKVTPIMPAKHCYACGSKPCVCPTPKPSTDGAGGLHDTSGNVLIPPPPSAVPVVTPHTTTSCGPETGKTQCIDTRTLASA
jgi:hypothetical protein